MLGLAILFARILRYTVVAVVGFCSVLPGLAQVANDRNRSPCWVGTWASSPQLAEPKDAPAELAAPTVTLLQFVRVSAGGKRIRVRFSNAFGTTPLVITSAQVATSTGLGVVKNGTEKELSFDGQKGVSIPAGALMVSDPLEFDLPALGNLAITTKLEGAPTGITAHPGSRTTSYILTGSSPSAGDLSQAVKVDHWYYINGIDVASQNCEGSVAIVGDSITDGRGSTTNGNDRWPDILARRLEAAPETRGIGVLNHGIGGNRLLRDGLGPNVLARFDRDVVAQTGVRWLVVFEGVNDIGTRLKARTKNESWATAEDIIAAFKQIITRAHTHGISVLGATITPFGGSFYSSPDTEAARQKVNHWILTSGAFDGVVDFDKVVRDPQAPDHLLPVFDTGDHLHLLPAGYAAMGDAIPLSLFGTNKMTGDKLRMAITFDDLPAHGPLPPGETRMQVISKIIAALRDAHMPPTYGFVNGARVEEKPGDIEVLRAWRAAGNPLGNHTWSHMNLNQHSPEEFEKDLVRNEPLLQQLMEKDDWKWLRFPYLAEGDSPEKRGAIREFLAGRGYKIAGVTMSFGDYLWTDPYARCSAKGDSKAISVLRSAYLNAAAENIDYYRSMSQRLYGRDIPYVLLMHVGALDSEMLPELLRLYKAKGFKFVTLPEAEADTFYINDIVPRVADGSDTLENAMAARHLEMPPYPKVPLDFDKMCR